VQAGTQTAARLGPSSRARGTLIALRRAALPVASVFLASLAAGAVHDLAAEHRTCEHGQLVEAEDAPRTAAEPFERGEAHALPSPGAADEEGAHAHCLAVAQRSFAAAPVAAHVAAAPTTARSREAAPARVAALADRGRLLLLAPKGSPPV
jgi:hypothetical protein